MSYPQEAFTPFRGPVLRWFTWGCLSTTNERGGCFPKRWSDDVRTPSAKSPVPDKRDQRLLRIPTLTFLAGPRSIAFRSRAETITDRPGRRSRAPSRNAPAWSSMRSESWRTPYVERRARCAPGTPITGCRTHDFEYTEDGSTAEPRSRDSSRSPQRKACCTTSAEARRARISRNGRENYSISSPRRTAGLGERVLAAESACRTGWGRALAAIATERPKCESGDVGCTIRGELSGGRSWVSGG